MRLNETSSKAPAPAKKAALVSVSAPPAAATSPAVAALLAQIAQMAGNMGGGAATADPGIPEGFNASAGDAIANGAPGTTPGSKSPNHTGPSNFQKFMSFIERPKNAITGGLDAAAHPGSVGHKLDELGSGFLKGIEGKSSTSWRDVLNDSNKYGTHGPHVPTWLNDVVGTAGDFVADPINAAGGPLVKGIKYGAKAAGLGSKAVEAADAAAAAGRVTENNAAVAGKGAINFPGRIGEAGQTIADSRLGTPQEFAQKALEDAQRGTAPIAKGAKDALAGKVDPAAFGQGQLKSAFPALEKLLAKPVVDHAAATEAAMKNLPKFSPLKELPDELQTKALANANARLAGGEFNASEWPAKFNMSNKAKDLPGVTPWDKFMANPAIRQAALSDNGFRAWWDGIKKEEQNKLLDQVNATALNQHNSAVADAIANARPDVITPKVPGEAAAYPEEAGLTKGQQSAVETAAVRHLKANAGQALTPEGQMKLRQTVANAYYGMGKNLLKDKLGAQATINKMYAAAEKLVEKSEPLQAPVRLSELLPAMKPQDILDNSGNLHHIIAGTSPDAASAAAHTLAQGGLAPSQTAVANILKSLKETGSASDLAATARVGGNAEPLALAKAAAKDTGTALPAINTERVGQKQAFYANKAADRLQQMFSSARKGSILANPFEHGAARQAIGSGNTGSQNALIAITKLLRGVPKASANAAYAEAQAAELAGTHAEGLAGQIQDAMHGLQGVLDKSGVSATEFQKYAPKSKEFSGESWAHTPLSEDTHAGQHMLQRADAINKATVKQHFVELLSHDWGVVKDTNPEQFAAAQRMGYKPISGDPSLQGYLFPPELVDRASKLLDFLKPGSITRNSFLNGYDKVNGLLKTGYTKYLPSHHVNNDLGQKFMGFLDGVPFKNYQKAIGIMAQNHAATTGDAVEGALGAGKVALRTKGGIELTGPELLHHAANEAGIFPSFAGLTDNAGADVIKDKNLLARGVDRFSSARENHNRLAHFMHALEQSPAKDLPTAVQDAAIRVNKSHADYGDLTQFERNVMRRVMPFYTWQRKIAPELIRQTAAHPGKAIAIPKIQQLIGQMNGQKPTGDNMFGSPNDLMPSYIHEMMQVPYFHHGSNAVYGSPRTPFDDVVGKEMNHPVANILGMVSPLAKIAYGLKSGQDLGTGIPITGKGQPSKITWAEQQLPLFGPLMGVTRRDPAHGFAPIRNDLGPDEKGNNVVKILNLLTAGGLSENTQRQRDAAVKEQERIAKDKAKKAKK